MSDDFGSVISQLTSYFEGRSRKVKVKDTLSDSMSLELGVPQRSVLSSKLYTNSLSTTRSHYRDTNHHLYSANTQVYIVITPQNVSTATVTKLSQSIQSWMANNKLKVNPDKTRFGFGSEYQQSKLKRLFSYTWQES